MININLPLSDTIIETISAGDEILLNGVIYIMRDAAHKRLYEILVNNEHFPLNLENAVVYYCGPTESKPGSVIGSAGPTTSKRMDKYTPLLLEKTGLKGMIGKGNRGQSVVDSIIQNKALYMAAIGGAGALISKRIISSEVILYAELGTEAVRRITIENFPVFAAIDSKGNNVYER